MNVADIIALVAQAVDLAAKTAPIVIRTAEDAKPLVMDLWQRLTGQPASAITEAEIDKLLTELDNRLNNPLPPAKPGDPDYTPPPGHD